MTSFTCRVSVLTVFFFIPLTIHENTVNDLKRGNKGLGGTACATETSATETEVRNANLGIGTPSKWDVLTKTHLLGTVIKLILS